MIFALAGGLLVDWQYVAGREAAALAAEGAWLRARGVALAVDFSRSTNLFPGLRLSADLAGAFAESLAALTSALTVKMPALGARDALLTLHNAAELPPANFSTPGAYAASVNATLRALAGAAAAANVTLHLRRSFRNDALAGAGLRSQAAFAAAAGVKLAPSLAYEDGAMGSDGAADAAQLFAGGGATLLALSGAWQGAARALEGAPLAPLLAANGSAAAWLRQVHAAAEAAGAWVLVDGAFEDTDEGRAAALADVWAVEDAVGV